MDEFDEEDLRVIRQIITAWKGLSAIGSIGGVIRKMFWFVVLIVAIYLASTGHFDLLKNITGL